MKKIVFLIIVSLILTYNLPVYSAIMVNPFYAISSDLEYQQIKENLKDSNHMYFQWGRLARNNDGMIQFTDKMYFGISAYDNRTEYGFPLKIDGEDNSEYIVQSGDSLFSISRKFGVPHLLIAEYNGLVDLNSISVGSILKIPKVKPDVSNKEDYKKNFPNSKALLSIYFDAEQYSDNKNAAIEFLNMEHHLWDQYIIQPIVDRIDSYQFDGVVLDFEAFRDSFNTNYYNISQRTDLKEKYTNFIRKLKDALGDKLLVVIVHPTNVGGYFDGYDIAKIEKNSDYIILMAYDYQHLQRYTNQDNVPAELYGKVKTIESSYNNQPYVQPFWKVEEAVKELLQIVENPNNILLGISIVGMKWVKYKKSVGGKDYFYYELYRPELHSIEAVDSQEQCLEQPMLSRKIVFLNNISVDKRKELTKNGDELVEIEYHFETPESLYLKYSNIVKEHNLSGLTVWRLGKGSDKLWVELLDMFSDDGNLYLEPLPTDKLITIVLRIGGKYMIINQGINQGMDIGRVIIPIIINDRMFAPISMTVEFLWRELRNPT